jgi:hypothetical protein
MNRTKIAFVVAAASGLALAAQGANAASFNPVMETLAARSSLMLQTHGCHRWCREGPVHEMSTIEHRHIYLGLAGRSARPCAIWRKAP